MQYEIHGHTVDAPSGEWGLYMAPIPGAQLTYCALSKDRTVANINAKPLDVAIRAVHDLRETAAEQAARDAEPPNHDWSLLVLASPPPSVDFATVRPNIRNTELFCEAVLAALEGE